MVRISDARMSGTAYGTVVLHAAPEAAAGGPLALVQNGDMIELDVRRRDGCISTSTTRSWPAGAPPGSRPSRAMDRGYAKLYVDHVTPGRTRAPTSTSWSAAVAPTSRARATEPVPLEPGRNQQTGEMP